MCCIWETAQVQLFIIVKFEDIVHIDRLLTVHIDRTVMIKHIAAGYRFPSGSEVLRVWCRLVVLTSISQQVLQDLVPAVLQHI